MSKDELLQAGIAAAKAGNRAQAAGLFMQVVKLDPACEQAWLGLGYCLPEAERRVYCFQRVLALNPHNRVARAELARLSQPEPAPTPARQSPFVETGEVSRPTAAAIPASAPAKPAAALAALVETPPVRKEAPQRPPAARPNPAPKKKKKSNRAGLIAIAAVFVTVLIIGVVLVGYSISRWSTPLGAAAGPTSAALSGPTSTATAASSPTPELPTPIPTSKPTVVYQPVYEKVPCPFGAPNASVSCGYLSVPEDRTGDPERRIRLVVAVYSSHSDTPADPVIFLQGGPGAGALELSASAYGVLVEPFLDKHDFIVFDQRGTGLSEPVLECDELTKMYLQDIRGLIDSTTRDLVYANAFHACSGLMRGQGVQLQAYTTRESAADVRDLLGALGYDKVNLYGASYGTRLAQVIMREYPEIVNTAILDSVVPVNTSVIETYFSAIDSGFETLFTACALDPACNSAYPNLEETFWDLVHELDENPVSVSSATAGGVVTQMVDGNLLIDLVAGSIKSAYFIGTAPQTISRFSAGDYSALIMQQSSLLFALDGIAPGLYINMICHEQILATTIEATAAATDPKYLRELSLHPFHGGLNDIFKTCRNWGALPPAYGENDLLVSDIPTLIFAGTYDPTTPPDYGKQIAPYLGNYYYFEFPNLGHAPSIEDLTGCGINMARQFLADPAREPSQTCMNNLKAPVFVVPYTGEPALLLQNVTANGYRVSVPRDWQTDGDGYYYRNNSPFDITEVGLFRVRGSIASIEEHFGSQLNGYRGLDGPLMPAGERQTDDFNWQLYTSSSYGRPVDIAMAEDRGWSIVVVQFSNKDEHEALYRTVFLPMIDSATR